MLHLHFAPSLDVLVSDFLTEVRKVWRDPFDSPNILVPSPALGKWLSMRFVDEESTSGNNKKSFRCIANLSFQTIEQYLWELLQPGDIHMLDQQDLQQVLCALLDDECIEHPVFAPVKQYLYGPDGIDPVKKVQLAARIANRFIEYEYNRPGFWRKTGKWDPPGIDGIWMKGKAWSGAADNETWQAELYRRMRECFSKPLKDEVGAHIEYLTLPQLYRLRRETITPVDAPLPIKIDPPDIFMFGVTMMSHFHRNLFVEISQISGINLRIYLTNPCAEFWEDVNTSRNSYRRKWSSESGSTNVPPAIMPRNPDDYEQEELCDLATGAPPATDQKLLELWGSAGKENIFLWCQDAQWNFEYHCPEWVDNEKEPESILEVLQFSLLRRLDTCSPPTNGCGSDNSLQILACPHRGREIEEIRELILDMVHDGTITMLNEVAVYLTDPIKYVPYIQRVFGCFTPYNPEYIPFCILGISGKETVFAQGISTLLALLRHKFDRAHVFELLRNPIVQHSRGIAPEDISIWEQWAEECAIFRGYNREHRGTMGDTGGTLTDAHTFELGMTRMLISDLANGPVYLHFRERIDGTASGNEQPIPVLPYRDFNTADRRNLERFCVTIDALYHDCEAVRQEGKKGIEHSVERMFELVSAWMSKIPDQGGVDSAAEGHMLRGFYDGLRKILLQKSNAGRDSLPFEEFCALISGCLPDEGGHNSAAWTGGITFAPLKPSMIVPHTVIIVAGLDDVLFPGSNEKPSWDLLSQKRIIGDSDRVRDNRFAFLELLHAARKRLILSYRARDMQKEVPLHPSSVVLELEAFLYENGFTVVDGDGRNITTVSRTIPWIVHESLGGIAEAGRKHGSWNRSDVECAYVAQSEHRVQHRYELDTCSEVIADTGLPSRFSGYEISEYLKNPLEYHLVRTLAITTEESPSTMTATDEPLASDSLSWSIFYRAIWITVLRNMFPDKKTNEIDDMEMLSDIACREALQQYAIHVASGNAPEAMMEAGERFTLFNWARSSIKSVLALKSRFTNHRLLEKTDLSLGRDGFPQTFDMVLNDGSDCTIDCTHSIVLIPRESDAQGITGILSIKKKGTIQRNVNLCVEGIAQLLYEIEYGLNTPPPVLVQLNVSDKPVDPRSLTDELSKIDSMRFWLESILNEMTHRGSDHYPFTIVEKITRLSKKNPMSWNDRLLEITRERLEKELTDEYGYISFHPAYSLVDPLLPSDNDSELRALADRRFGPILEGWMFSEETTV